MGRPEIGGEERSAVLPILKVPASRVPTMRFPRLLAPAGTADLWAGLAGGLFAPLASFGLGLPLWASLPGAALVFLGTRLALAPRGPFEGLDGEAIDAAGRALAAEVIAAAWADLDRLRAAASAVRAPEVRGRLEHLHRIAARVAREVEKQPARLSGVRRLLTYYLPASVRLGEGFRTLESAHRPDAARLSAAGAMIARLDTVFARHADRLSAVEVEGLDVELKLLSDAIRAEERSDAPSRAAPEPRAEPSPWR